MATNLSHNAVAAPYGIFASSTTQELPLGTRFVDQSGNAYRYVKAGGTALVVGTLLQAAAEATNHQNLTAPASAIGVTSVAVTLGATAATANQYAEGWMVITVTPGVGYKYRISSHPAADASASLTVTLDDAIQIALTSSSRIDLLRNPYNAVIVYPTTATGAAVGVAVYPIAASSFGFIQSSGSAVILSDGGSTVGTNVSASNATAGSVEAAVTAQAFVGVAMTGVATTEYGSFLIHLD